MDISKLNATIRLVPRNEKVSEQLRITRGESAEFLFDFMTKPYTFEILDQVYVLFGTQAGLVKKLKMFTYLIPTVDLEALPGKTYYSITSFPEPDAVYKECKAEPVPALELLDKKPLLLGLYEEVFQGDRRTTLHMRDSNHFNYIGVQDGEVYFSYLSVYLSAQETLAFEPGTDLKQEFVFRVDTDTFASTGYTDSNIIEPMGYLQVVDSTFADSLWSKVAMEV